jgi:pseudomonalisin
MDKKTLRRRDPLASLCGFLCLERPAMPSIASVRTLLAGLLMLAASCTIAMGQGPVNRILEPISEAQVVTLEKSVHPLAREEFDRGVVGAEMELGQMVLELEPSTAQQVDLDALVAAQHDPHSPLYRQWLTPAEYGARFGVSAKDMSRITTWLIGRGFTVEEVPASNRLIVFSGTAGQVAETFHTEIHRYRLDGVEHIANAQRPQIPAALHGVVGGVVSLHDFRRKSEIETRTALGAQSLYTSGSTHYLFPADWATIYDLNSLYAEGTTGTGSLIAIVGRSNIDPSDITAFRATAGLAANNPAVILAGADPGLVAGDQDEATLDVEWSGAVAPAATVTLVVGASTETTDGVDLSAQYIVNHALARVVSISYGSCEQEMGIAELAFYDSLWEQAASQGMSALVAAGDAGAAGCYEGSSASGSGTAVNGLCSSPYATCVGGTEFNEGADDTQYWAATNSANYGTALSYIPEEVWNESGLAGGSGLWASGGGASVVYAQPTWQKGVGATSGGMRTVPDLAVSAAEHDGYVIYENGSYSVVSGTSASSPSFAGVMALVIQKQGGTGVGNANPGLYSLLSAAHNPFHATPSGNNSVPGVTGFSASGVEYNLATGLGSVDGALLASEWGAGSATGVDFALTASAAGGTVVVGQTTTFTVSAAESGATRKAVALTATGPSGVTVAMQPGSIAPGTTSPTATVTIAVSAAATAGTQVVTLTGSDTSGTQTLTYALTVQPALVITLAVLPTTLVAGTVNTGYPQTAIAAVGGTTPYAYAVSSGILPTGLTLSAGGALAGTPTTAGLFTFTVTATDSSAGTGPHTGSQSYTVAINLPTVSDFTIDIANATSSSATVLPGESVRDNFIVSPANEAGTFTNAIALSVSGLPIGATTLFSPASVAAGSGATTVILTIQLPQASAGAQLPGGFGSGLAGRLAPLSLALLLLPLVGRLRRMGKLTGRLISSLLLVITGMTAMAGLTGCGSFTGFLAHSSQTYTVTVTGTSGTLSHSATVTLTVE